MHAIYVRQTFFSSPLLLTLFCMVVKLLQSRVTLGAIFIFLKNGEINISRDFNNFAADDNMCNSLQQCTLLKFHSRVLKLGYMKTFKIHSKIETSKKRLPQKCHLIYPMVLQKKCLITQRVENVYIL